MTMFFSGGASALGLGEIQGQAVMGQGLQLEVALLGAEKTVIDSSCLRLIKPASGDDLPWLRKGVLTVRKGAAPVVVIRSDAPLRDPILQLAIQVTCGHEVSREYVVMASPVQVVDALSAPRAVSEAAAPTPLPDSVARRPVRVRQPVPVAAPVSEPINKLPPKKAERRTREPFVGDRLFLSDGGVGEPSLRLATEMLFQAGDVRDAQRDILRLEFRLLMAMHEQAVSQLAAAEKLRNLEGSLGELQQRAANVAQRVEKDGVQGAALPAGVPPPSTAPVPVVAPPVAKSGNAPSDAISDWSLYGVLIGSIAGLIGWLFWRNRWGSQRAEANDDLVVAAPDVLVDPQRRDEREEPGGIDLPFEPVEMGMPMRVDVDLDNVPDPVPEAAKPPSARQNDSLMSINATSLDEHFEANPVMELADIMLSFGRVKGAAQALQEFIDNNPQEALQPWIRLMDVYRLAGMRAEFEAVARNLNQHFNVEVQRWSDEPVTALSFETGAEVPATPMAPRPGGLEDMPRLMNAVLDQWAGGDIVAYLYQLLRDNREGQRQGFPMAVVEDILFLIELKETVNRMEFA